MRSAYVDTRSRAIIDVTSMGSALGFITRINVPRAHRGRGVARRLLRRVMNEADAQDVTLELWPIPTGLKEDGGLGFAALTAWYTRCGFEQKENGLMIRQPQYVCIEHFEESDAAREFRRLDES